MPTPTLMNSPQPTFFLLSSDLEALVFEFLPLSDFASLRLVCRNFNETLCQFPNLWGRHLVRTFLNPARDLTDVWEDDWDHTVPLDTDTTFAFHQMKDSEAVIKQYYNIYTHLEAFLGQFLNKEAYQELAGSLEENFLAPSFPFPCLKRDIHFFTTKTMFQNFLTEVYFGIQSRVLPTDGKQMLIKDVVDKLRGSYNSDATNEKKLLVLQRNPLSQYRRSQEARVAGGVKSSQEEQAVEEEHDQSENVLERGNTWLFSTIEEFYSIIYELMTNRCEMILVSLKAVESPQELLNEYCRQWSKFVLTVIEVNRSLLPFSQFLNELYKKSSQKSQNVPEFSVWKLMIKIWQTTIFDFLSDKLHDAFKSLLLVVRQNMKTLDANPSAVQSTKAMDELPDPYDSFDLPDLEDDNSKVLRGFYNAVSDLSYDEVTIFYWECTTISKETPKGALQEIIAEETSRLYKSDQELLTQKPTEMIKLLENDHETTTNIFGKELSLMIRECQLGFVRSFITEYLVSKCDVLEKDLALSVNDQKVSKAGDNFERLISFIGAQEVIQSEIATSKHAKESLLLVIEKDQQRLFNPLISLSERINEEIESQKEKNQEIYSDLVERGFGQGDGDEPEDILFLVMSDHPQEPCECEAIKC